MVVLRCSRTHLHGTHHSALSVVENVAVKHPFAWTLVKTHQEARRLLHGDIDGILPGQRAQRMVLLIEHYERKTVQVKRMVPLRVVLDDPELSFAQLGQVGLSLPMR